MAVDLDSTAGKSECTLSPTMWNTILSQTCPRIQVVIQHPITLCITGKTGYNVKDDIDAIISDIYNTHWSEARSPGLIDQIMLQYQQPTKDVSEGPQ